LRFNSPRTVAPKEVGFPVAPQNAKPVEVSPFGGMTQRSRDLALVRRFQVPLNRSEWLARLAIAQAGRPVTGDELTPPLGEPAPVDLASGANIVGFGCVTVAASPHPNEQYQW
jgi:hypothetical protein